MDGQIQWHAEFDNLVLIPGTKTFTISPANGFCFSKLYVDGNPVYDSCVSTPQTYRFTNVTADHTIEAYFAVNRMLLHRWSFNGDLRDSIGGTLARIIDPDNNPTTGNWILSDHSITLGGGHHNRPMSPWERTCCPKTISQ